MKTARRLILIIFMFCSLPRVANSQSLDAILERAREYASHYEEELGTIIGEEEYTQTAVWQSESSGAPITGSARGGAVASARGRREVRRLSSDFLLVRVGTTWFGVRNVQRVDGLPSISPGKSFAEVFTESPEALPQQLDAIYRDNARYNIGDFQRTFNVPTFPLTILRQNQFTRFLFELGAERKIENVRVREVHFSEVARPTLVHGPKGEDRFSHGTLWIDPETGSVLKSELIVDGKSLGTTFKAAMIVEYEASARLGILVPRTMQERYDTDGHYITCLAIYSNFGRFEITVR